MKNSTKDTRFLLVVLAVFCLTCGLLFLGFFRVREELRPRSAAPHILSVLPSSGPLFCNTTNMPNAIQTGQESLIVKDLSGRLLSRYFPANFIDELSPEFRLTVEDSVNISSKGFGTSADPLAQSVLERLNQAREGYRKIAFRATFTRQGGNPSLKQETQFDVSLDRDKQEIRLTNRFGEVLWHDGLVKYPAKYWDEGCVDTYWLHFGGLLDPAMFTKAEQTSFGVIQADNSRQDVPVCALYSNTLVAYVNSTTGQLVRLSMRENAYKEPYVQMDYTYEAASATFPCVPTSTTVSFLRPEHFSHWVPESMQYVVQPESLLAETVP